MRTLSGLGAGRRGTALAAALALAGLHLPATAAGAPEEGAPPAAWFAMGGGERAGPYPAAAPSPPPPPPPPRPSPSLATPPLAEPMPPPPEVAVEAEEEGGDAGWLEGVESSASLSNWFFSPIDIKTEEGEKSDWSRVETEEVYDVESLNFYRASLKILTRYMHLEGSYETNRGLNVSFGDSSVLDFLLAFANIPFLERISVRTKRLSFNNGSARLQLRSDERLVDEEDFSMTLSFTDIRYRLEDHKVINYVFGRRMSYALPRNAYLDRKTGEGDGTFHTYEQISDTLMLVDSTTYMVGVGLDRKKGKGPFRFLYRLGIGGGPYELRTLSTDEHIDEGSLVTILLGVEFGLEWELSENLRFGVKDVADLMFLAPIGLPDDLEKRAEKEGTETEDLSLTFGTIDLLNNAYVYLGMVF